MSPNKSFITKVLCPTKAAEQVVFEIRQMKWDRVKFGQFNERHPYFPCIVIPVRSPDVGVLTDVVKKIRDIIFSVTRESSLILILSCEGANQIYSQLKTYSEIYRVGISLQRRRNMIADLNERWVMVYYGAYYDIWSCLERIIVESLRYPSLTFDILYERLGTKTPQVDDYRFYPNEKWEDLLPPPLCKAPTASKKSRSKKGKHSKPDTKTIKVTSNKRIRSYNDIKTTPEKRVTFDDETLNKTPLWNEETGKPMNEEAWWNHSGWSPESDGKGSNKSDNGWTTSTEPDYIAIRPVMISTPKSSPSSEKRQGS